MEITDQEFERAFYALISSLTRAQICSTPGVLSLLREEYHNEIIEIALDHRETETTGETQ